MLAAALLLAVTVRANCGGGGMSPPQNMPCPLPPWPPTFNMTLSTFIMPARNEGYLHQWGETWERIRDYGIIDVDWSNAQDV
eukprot:SAG22_NODE_17645_length_301_cov_0.762376_1_plen_81_part_01